MNTMRHLTVFTLLTMISQVCLAQPTRPSTATVNQENIQTYVVPLERTVHILSPEPILYVDISSPHVDGDLPEKNICRLKPVRGKMQAGGSFTVTLVTRSLVSVYRLVCAQDSEQSGQSYVITMDPMHSVRLNSSTLSASEFKSIALKALGEKSRIRHISVAAKGMRGRVNNIFVVGEYLLFDISLDNHTNMVLDIDEVRFKLTDRKQLNAHVSQDILLTPAYSYYDHSEATITANWRNFYLFPRFHFGSDKLLKVELSEEQISGRKLELQVESKHILSARHLDK